MLSKHRSSALHGRAKAENPLKAAAALCPTTHLGLLSSKVQFLLTRQSGRWRHLHHRHGAASVATETLPLSGQEGSIPPVPASIVPLGMNMSAYPSMAGKNVLVTGAAHGIGFNTARLLAAMGATVYMADVDEEALDKAADTILQQVPWADIEVTPKLDLGDIESVHEWADRWDRGTIGSGAMYSSNLDDDYRPLRPVPNLHVLINNAGANFMGVEPWYTAQGVSGLAQVNFVGPYILTRRLTPSLWGSDHRARVINVASVTHRWTELPDDPQLFLRDWFKHGMYRVCKHATVVFTLLLQKAFDKAAQEGYGRMGVTCVAVDPGAVYSNIWARSRLMGKPPGSIIARALFATPQDACSTLVHAAAHPDVEGGTYLARGLFASGLVTALWKFFANLFCCLDWPLRLLTRGKLGAGIKATRIAAPAQQAVDDGRGVALWDAVAELAEMPKWDKGAKGLSGRVERDKQLEERWRRQSLGRTPTPARSFSPALTPSM